MSPGLEPSSDSQVSGLSTPIDQVIQTEEVPGLRRRSDEEYRAETERLNGLIGRYTELAHRLALEYWNYYGKGDQDAVTRVDELDAQMSALVSRDELIRMRSELEAVTGSDGPPTDYLHAVREVYLSSLSLALGNQDLEARAAMDKVGGEGVANYRKHIIGFASQLGSTPMRLAEELEGTNAGLIYTSITDALDLREKKFSTAIQGVGIKSYADVRAFRDSWTSLRGDIQQAELEASAMSKLKVETTTDSITELFRHLGIVEQFDPDYIIHNQTEEQQAGITSLAIAVNPPHVNGVIFNYPKGARGAGSGQTAHELAHMAYGMYAPENGTYAEKFGITGTANETMAFLIESLFSNRRWLYHVYGMSEQESNLIASRSQLGDELFLREYVGGLGFQLELERMERSLEGGIYTQEGDFKPEVYAAFRSSLGKAYAGRLQLSDDDLRSRYSKFLMPKLEYLIAFAASEFLSEYLEERWGKEWFENPEAGDLLKGVMKDLHVKGIEEVLSGLPHPYGSSRHFNESNYTSLIQVRYQM